MSAVPKTTDFDSKLTATQAGVLYWPLYLEIQKRRLDVALGNAVVKANSILPDVDFLKIMSEIGLPVTAGNLGLLKRFNAAEELVSRRGSRLWYWLRRGSSTTDMLLICFIDKGRAEAIEILSVENSDAWYLDENVRRLNRALETYSIDILHRVVQMWVWLHGELSLGRWVSFEDIRQALLDYKEMLQAEELSKDSDSAVETFDSSNLEQSSEEVEVSSEEIELVSFIEEQTESLENEVIETAESFDSKEEIPNESVSDDEITEIDEAVVADNEVVPSSKVINLPMTINNVSKKAIDW